LFRCARRHLAASLILFGCLLSSSAHAVTLAWIPNPPDPPVSHYTLYWGTESGNYTDHADTGLNTQYQVTGTDPDQQYFFAVKAFGFCGDPPEVCESDYSDEVIYFQRPGLAKNGIIKTGKKMANDFTNDPNCVAVWRFEDTPGFTADSQGGNTLTNFGADVETTTVFEGSRSAKFVLDNQDNMTIADADQDAGLPFRYADGGSMEKSFTICLRVYPLTLPSVVGGNMALVAKFHPSSDTRVFSVRMDSNDIFAIAVGYNNGSSYQTVYFTVAIPSATQWYSVAFSYDYSDYGYRIRAYDHVADALLASDATGNFGQAIDPLDIALTIGSVFEGGFSDTILDEIVVFNRVLSVSEIDDYIAGTFGAAGTAYQRSVSGAFPAPAGGLSRQSGFARAIAGDL
jgi:hypothetical protein